MVDNQEKALQAIHRLLIEGRLLSYKKEFEKLPAFFDDVEYLVALVLESENRNDFFEEYLKEACEKFDLTNIYLRFKE